jgi:hypothetical protein
MRIAKFSLVAMCCALPVTAQAPAMRPVSLHKADVAEYLNVMTQETTYRGHAALRAQDANPSGGDDGERMVVLHGTKMRDGAVELLMRQRICVDLLGWRFAWVTAELSMNVSICDRKMAARLTRCSEAIQRSTFLSRDMVGRSSGRRLRANMKAMLTWSRARGRGCELNSPARVRGCTWPPRANHSPRSQR